MCAVLKVVLIYRKPIDGAYSIEEIFHAIAGALGARVEVIEYVVGKRRDILKDAWGLWKLNADIYHVTGDVHYFVPLLPSGKTVLTVHDINHYLCDLRGCKRWIYKWLWLLWPIRSAYAVTTISQETKDNIIGHLGFTTRHIEIIENCYNPLLKNVLREFNLECPVILHLGTQAHKNVPRLIEALRGVKCKLVLIGQLNDELVRKLSECGIDYVSRKNLTYEEIVREYVNCDLVSFVSLAEGFGVPIIEAQASGRPLVTSNLSPMREVAGDGACLVEPMNVLQIRNAILRIIANSDYRERLVDRGLINAGRYSPDIISGRYLDLYRSIDC